MLALYDTYLRFCDGELRAKASGEHEHDDCCPHDECGHCDGGSGEALDLGGAENVVQEREGDLKAGQEVEKEHLVGIDFHYQTLNR